MAAATVRTHFTISGMDCPSCASKIERATRPLPGVTDANVSIASNTLTLDHTDDADLASIERKVSNLGYNITRADQRHAGAERVPHPASHDAHVDEHTEGAWWQSRKGLLTITCGLALAVAWGVGALIPQIATYAFTVALFVGLMPIARRAFVAAFNGTPFSIEMLMTIAATGAVLINATEEAAAVVFLFLVGELLEGVAAGRARASIKSLASLVPQTARLEADGAIKEVPANTLAVGAVIVVRPGDRIAADGVIIEGESAIDEALVTGESVPVRKKVDENVYAGTINGEGVLRIRVSAASADNTISRVIKLVEEAQGSKAPTQRFIDRFSTYYTPGVLVIAALVAVVPPLALGGEWQSWIYKALAILLIGCPCALVISTPAAIAASLSAGARRGLLIKGGATLEQAGKITVAAFDKTGTITEGRPRVTDVVGFGMPEHDILRCAAAVEAGSSHPLALAILKKASAEGVDIPTSTHAQALAGKGVSAKVEGRDVFLGAPQAANEKAPLAEDQKILIERLNAEGKTASVLLVDDKVAGVIALRDEPRADAITGMRALAEIGIKTLMLTGDNRKTAEAIGSHVGASDVRAELLPNHKMQIVQELKGRGEIVAKVGDGINDAPALAAADIGIAMGSGTDVALETADAAILHGRVGDVAALVRLSRRTMDNIRQNISIALGLKALFLVTTLLGITGLWPAILADTGATVFVTANAMRLLRFRVA